MLYGNETIFTRFSESIATGEQPEYISMNDALGILEVQHEIVAESK